MATDPVNNNSTSKIDKNLLKKTGVNVDAKILKELKETSIHAYKENGVLVREKAVDMILDNGTRINMPIPQKGAKIVKTGENNYDFEKLNHADINDTENSDFYNFMGCSNTNLYSTDDKDDWISIGNHADGTKSKAVTVLNFGSNTDLIDTAEGLETTVAETEYVGVWSNTKMLKFNRANGRHKDISLDENGKKVVKTYSHDGKLLKESYVNATERTLSDGYKIKTSPDGKEKWYFDPKGKQISGKEFLEAKHPYPVKKKEQ